MLEPPIWTFEAEVFDFGQDSVLCQTLESTILGAFKCLP
jgi:hypothetical protein